MDLALNMRMQLEESGIAASRRDRACGRAFSLCRWQQPETGTALSFVNTNWSMPAQQPFRHSCPGSTLLTSIRRTGNIVQR